MELAALISALQKPDAYPHAVDEVLVRQTHISVVFLAGPWVYKIKKPVNFGFLDFSTLALREHFCREEVRLNARTAGDIYRGVVPVTAQGDRMRVDGSGPVIEWAVKMERLADADCLEQRLAANEVSTELVGQIGRRVAEFHRTAERSPRMAEQARSSAVAALVRENLAQAAASAGPMTIVVERVRELSEQWLTKLQTLFDQRADEGRPCDTHGDLRLEHIYLLGDAAQPQIVIIDCIEFSERFRYADPVADMAFLAMDFKFHNHRKLAREFVDGYFQAAADPQGRLVLPFYTAYRAVVRAKVESLKCGEPEVPSHERELAAHRMRAYWMLALNELERPERRPCLLLIGGLPGTGKSALARALAERGDFVVIRSDVVRKELAGLAASDPAAAAFDQGIYTPQWSDRVYGECERRALALLREGKRVIIDASFGSNRRRQSALDVAHRLCVPAAMVVCHAEAAIVRQRLANRVGDASDADWNVYLEAEKRWEPEAINPPSAVHRICTDGPLEQTADEAFRIVEQSSESEQPGQETHDSRKQT